MDALLVGGWLALAIRGAERVEIIRRAKAAFFVAILILLIDAGVERGLDWQTSQFINTIGYTVVAVASTALIALAIKPDGVAGKLFSQSWLRWLGKYSYGIYVWHMVIGPPIVEFSRKRLNIGTSSKIAHILVGWVLGVAICLIAGFISYQAFEVHFLRLKRFFPYSESKRHPVSA